MRIALALSCCLLTAALSRPARAQAPMEGFAPDVQINGGVGIGLRGKLDNNFLGRVRVGGLYASEPYWFDAGVTVEAGALAGLAIGGELEWNQFQGWFANAGLAYAKHQRVTGHLGLGYMIFGLEWQHDFTRAKPNEALLLTIRFPLGFWWFTSDREPRSPPAPPPTAAAPSIRSRPAPAQPTAASAPASPAPAQVALDQATLAELRGDHAAAAEALRRAYAAQPDPQLWLRIADADLAQGKPALALQALQHFLAAPPTPELLVQRPAAERRARELEARVSRLRVSLAAASGGEQIWVDGVERPDALAGYDVLLDPGPHQLRVLRAGVLVLTQAFELAPGQLLRLELPLSAARP